MTQANKLSLNFPSLCPLVSSFINWTANVVLIFSFLQLNLKWPRLLVVYGPELLFLDISIHSMTPFLFFFLSHGDEWTRHTVSRHSWPWQRRHSLQVSSRFHLNFLCTLAKCEYSSSPWQRFLNDHQHLEFISTFDSKNSARHLFSQELVGKVHLYCLFNISASASLLGEQLIVHH